MTVEEAMRAELERQSETAYANGAPRDGLTACLCDSRGGEVWLQIDLVALAQVAIDAMNLPTVGITLVLNRDGSIVYAKAL